MPLRRFHASNMPGNRRNAYAQCTQRRTHEWTHLDRWDTQMRQPRVEAEEAHVLSCMHRSSE
jgi:hypothetical protein